MIRLSFLGAMSCVGASGVLLDTGAEKLVLDYGTKVMEIPPKFPLPVGCKPDAVLLSHCHLDHSGGIPLFNVKDKCQIYAVNVTKPLTELLLLDSIKISHEEGVDLPFSRRDVERSIRNFALVEYRERIKIHTAEVTYYNAGHVPGSAQILVRVKGKHLLYTGDIKTIGTRLLKGADLKIPRVDWLITESTYADREHPDRKSQEKELVRIVRETLERGGVCVVAGFAVGRIQELLLILDKYGIDYPLYMDGMAKKATTIINEYNRLLKNPNALDKALDGVTYVNKEKMRKRIVRQPSVVLTTSGMLNGGPIVWYLKKLYKDRNSSLVLTGYQVEGVPGRTLLETGRYIAQNLNLDVKMMVRRLDLSAHAGRGKLLEFIDKLNPEKVFCVHGDHTEEFASELRTKGYDAVAPLANNRFFTLE